MGRERKGVGAKKRGILRRAHLGAPQVIGKSKRVTQYHPLRSPIYNNIT
jgi:hypothetical protein